MLLITILLAQGAIEDSYVVDIESASEVSAIRNALDGYQDDGHMEQVDRVTVEDI